jgi:hypothetical protein
MYLGEVRNRPSQGFKERSRIHGTELWTDKGTPIPLLMKMMHVSGASAKGRRSRESVIFSLFAIRSSVVRSASPPTWANGAKTRPSVNSASRGPTWATRHHGSPLVLGHSGLHPRGKSAVGESRLGIFKHCYPGFRFPNSSAYSGRIGVRFTLGYLVSVPQAGLASLVAHTRSHAVNLLQQRAP